VALVSRIDKFIGLFCKRALQKREYSAKETYDLIDPTDRSHPIYGKSVCDVYIKIIASLRKRSLCLRNMCPSDTKSDRNSDIDMKRL